MASTNLRKEKIILNVIQDNETMTCYAAVEKYDRKCQKTACKQWINFPEGKNCVILASQSGPLTLNEIGKIYGLTRMRICQIEKNIYQKIKNFIL